MMKGLKFNVKMKRGSRKHISVDKKRRRTGKTKKRALIGIRLKLTGAFIIPVILIVMLGFISYDKASDGIIKHYISSIQNTMVTTGKYFDLGFKSVDATAAQLAVDEALLDKKQYAAYKSISKSVIAKLGADDLLKNIHIISVEDVAFSSSGGFIRNQIYDEFAKSKEMSALKKTDTDAIWIGVHPYIDNKLKSSPEDYCASYIRKVKPTSGYNSTYGDTAAYIIIDVTIDTVKDVLNGLNLGKDGLAGFISADGREILSEKPDKEETLFTNQQFYKDAAKGKKESGYKYVTYKDKEYLFVYTKVASSNSMFCGLISKASILEQAQDIKTITVIIVILASIIAILIGALMAGSFGRVIKKTVKTLRKTADGDLTSELRVRRKDEFGILAKNVNDMIKSMKFLIDQVRQVSRAVNNSTADVGHSSEILFEATKEINLAIEEIQKGIVEQAREMESCLEQMSSLSDKVNITYANTGEIEKIAQDTRKVAGNGIDMIGELRDKTKDTIEITSVVIDSIESLSNESRSIGSIVGTINDIAEETTLLSLNASIEAAKAGDAGRGFSVVASEIRKLADQSVKAAGEIQEIINNIQMQTDNTVSTAKEAKSIVDNQVDSLRSTIEVFKNIDEQVEDLAETLSEISGDMKDIENAKDTTLHAMEDISAVSEETANVIDSIHRSVTDQADAVKKLNDATTGLGKDTEKLSNAISIFKI